MCARGRLSIDCLSTHPPHPPVCLLSCVIGVLINMEEEEEEEEDYILLERFVRERKDGGGKE